MTKRLPDLEAWAIFAKVAELGSFSQAANELGLSNPTVSKAISRLEIKLGFSLFSRTSRRISLTEAGRSSLERARRMLDEAWALEDEAGDQSARPRGLVRVSAPLSFGAAYLGATLPALLEAYPEITLDFQLSDRKVDLIGEGFDLALRIASLEDSSLLARRLASVRILLVGAPSYFQTYGHPTRPADLAKHCALAYSGAAMKGLWRFSHPTLGIEEVEPPIRIWSDNVDMLNPTLIAGQGMALQPEFMVWRELQSNQLAIAMPEWTVPALGLYLLTPPGSRRPLRVQVVIDHLVRELSGAPWS